MRVELPFVAGMRIAGVGKADGSGRREEEDNNRDE